MQKHMHMILLYGACALLMVTTWLQAARANRAEQEASKCHDVVVQSRR